MTNASGVRVIAAAGLLLVSGLAGGRAAWAQTQPDNRPPDAPLGGPEVRDRKVPGVAGSFGDNAEGQKRRMADRIPPRVMREAMRAIMEDDASDNLRATPEQRERIQGYVREYEVQSRDYLEQHRKELEELRGQLPDGGMSGPAGELFRRLDGDKRRGPGAPGDGEGAKRRRGPAEQGAGKARKAAEEIPVEVREKLRDIAAGMPPFEQVYTKVWAELRPEQQKAVDERLAEFRERQTKMREDMYVEKRAGKNGGGKQPPPGRRRPADGARIGPGPGGPDGPPPGGPRAGGQRQGPADADRRDRLLRAFERMSPEQQEQVLSRMESRGGDQPAPRPQGKRPPNAKRGDRKPAPDSDHMPVPPPPPPEDGDEMNPDRP